MRRVLVALVAIYLATGFIRVSLVEGQAPSAATVTYTSGVSALFATHCAACHHAGGPAPFSLTSYEEARPHAAEIADAVERRFMPRWKPEPGFGGPFIGERRLSDAEIGLLRTWADAGAPRGGDEHTDHGAAGHGGWRLGTPDLVLTLSQPFVLQPGSHDVFRNFAIRIPTTTSRFVKAVEFLPDNHVVTHHANIRVDPTSSSTRLDARDPLPGYEGIASPTAVFPDGYFLGWTPGQAATFLPDGLAWKLTPASSLAVELHMVPTTSVESVNFRIGLYFTDVPPTKMPVMLRLGRQDIDIAAGNANYVIRDEFTLPVDVDLLSLQPHAHSLAKEIKGFAVLPDGTRRWLLYIKDWEFHVQDVYRLVTPIFLPSGTTVQMEYTYDNSAANPRRPATSPVRVRWGQYTSDEMGDLWLQFLPRDAADRDRLTELVRAKELNEDLVGYKALLARNPDEALLHANMAGALIALGKRDQAIGHLRTHVRLEPGSAMAHYNLATALAASRRPDEALSEFRRAAALEPDNPMTYNGIGGVLLNAKDDLSGALAAFERSVTVDQSYANGFNNLGIVFARMGQPDRALAAHLRAAELDADSADARFNAAGLLEAHGHYREALGLYREASALAPRDYRTQLKIAWLLATSPPPVGDPPEALRLVQGLAIEHPDDPEVIDALAAAAAANRQFKEATASARRALMLLRERREDDWAEAVEQRLDLYRQGRPYVAPEP